jgi:hypothetical protein
MKGKVGYMFTKMLRARTIRVFSAFLIAAMLVTGVIPMSTPYLAYAAEAADEEGVPDLEEPPATALPDTEAAEVQALVAAPDDVTPLATESDLIILHGGEILTTSSTGTGSDPMHTQVKYKLAADAAGEITITPDPHNNGITIIGNGAGSAPNNITLNIAKGINLTIEDVYLRTANDAYLINFNGILGNSNLMENQLTLVGMNILENDVSNGVKAVIHAAPAVSLEIVGNGDLYLKKNTAGAGIGGNGVSQSSDTPETPGLLTIGSGNFYLSGSGNGALIGTGGGGNPAVPNDITINGGNLNVATASAAAAIGGSANSPGGNVYLNGGAVTATTDAQGSAIGRGGSATPGTGGGQLTISGGSLKTVATQGAVSYWGGLAGVTDLVVTASVIDTGSTPAAPGLLDFNTSDLSTPASYFSVLANNAPFYRGGLHTYDYNAAATGNILNSWTAASDPKLYLELPKSTTRLSVNGAGYTLEWHEGSETFSWIPGDPDDGSFWNGMTDTTWYDESAAEFWLQGGGQLAGLAEIVNGTAVGIDQDDFTGKTIHLLNDINLNSLPWTPIGGGETTITFEYTSPVNGFKDASLTNVIDDESYSFNGTFNGNAKAITGFRIDATDGLQGFFGYLGEQGIVNRLTINGTLRTTTSWDAVGGLVGFNRGLIDHCTVQVNVLATTAYNVGGVAGFNDGRTGNGIIQYTANQGNVHGYVKVGGITGQNAGFIKSCYNVGNVNGTNASSKNGVGGIAGRNGNNNTAVEVGVIVDSFAICEVGRDGGQKWVGGITGFQNNLSHIENSYFAGSFPNWNNNSNNPIAGYTDIPALATEVNLNNYTLNTLQHSGSAIGEIGIAKTIEEMKSPAFIGLLNGIDGVGRAYLPDLASAAALNDGFPILRGVHTEDTAVPTGVRIVQDPVHETNNPEDPDSYYYTQGDRFNTKGFLAVADFSDGTTEKINNIELSIPGMLSDTDTSITITAVYGEFSASRSYPLVVIRDDLLSINVITQPSVKIYGDGEQFNTYLLSVRANFNSGRQLYLTEDQYTYAPRTLHTGDTGVTLSYVFNEVEKTVTIPVTVLSVTRPEEPEPDSFLIENEEELIWFTEKVSKANWTEYNATLMNDLDMRGTLFYPIGFYEGTFDGNGKSITLGVQGVSLNNSYLGLFKTIGEDGIVKNLTIKGTVTGGTYLGGVAGQSYGTIENCRNEAVITGTGTAMVHAGGIVGRLDGTILGCENTGSVGAQNYTGGIAGCAYAGALIEDSTNTGAITAVSSGCGGISGVLEGSARVLNSTNKGAVTGTYSIGGIVGDHRGTGILSGLRNEGAVSATSTATTASYSVGGIAGYLSGSPSAGGVIESMNIGSVSGTVQNTGGIVGYIVGSGTVTSCYNGGTVTGLAARINTAVGGVIGAVNSNAVAVTGGYNTGIFTKSGSYASYQGPVIGQYKPAGAINETKINNNYYSADSVPDALTVSVGSVVTAANRETVRTLLSGITTERIVMLNAGYPIPISLYTGPIGTGNVDGDGDITVFDAVLILRAIVGLDAFSDEQIVAADIDGDEFITVFDVVLLLRRIVGLE